MTENKKKTIDEIFGLILLDKVDNVLDFVHSLKENQQSRMFTIDLIVDTSSSRLQYAARMLKTFIYMLYLIHIIACAYYWISTYEGVKANEFVYNGNGNAYIRCFYFATKTATSIGKLLRPLVYCK